MNSNNFDYPSICRNLGTIDHTSILESNLKCQPNEVISDLCQCERVDVCSARDLIEHYVEFFKNENSARHYIHDKLDCISNTYTIKMCRLVRDSDTTRLHQ